jgi:hypothetical protein
MIKYYKFGFGRTTDYVNEEIRLGRMSRYEGIEIIEAYDGKCSDKLIEDLCCYLKISVKDFWNNIAPIVNRDLFDSVAENQWIPKFKVGKDL